MSNLGKPLLDLSKIQLVDFPVDQYYQEPTDKNQIVIHHTVSGPGARGDISWWLQNSDRIATHFIIERDGNIVQCFNSKYWAHHLGVKNDVFKSVGLAPINTTLNKKSISIELDSWGGILHDKAAAFQGALIDYGHTLRGYRYYEEYTESQIESLRQILVFFGKKFSIPLTYNPDMWDVSKNALSGKSGVWTHVSYRYDKSDCHPQPTLIEMLKSLHE